MGNCCTLHDRIDAIAPSPPVLDAHSLTNWSGKGKIRQIQQTESAIGWSGEGGFGGYRCASQQPAVTISHADKIQQLFLLLGGDVYHHCVFQLIRPSIPLSSQDCPLSPEPPNPYPPKKNKL